MSTDGHGWLSLTGKLVYFGHEWYGMRLPAGSVFLATNARMAFPDGKVGFWSTDAHGWLSLTGKLVSGPRMVWGEAS